MIDDRQNRTTSTPTPKQNMLFVTLLICLGFINALPTTTKRCQALVENTPWTISDLTAFEAASNSSALSYISFHFCDVNPGLELETTCLRTIAPGTSASVIDPSTYYACNGNEVRFIYAGGSLSLERSYDDDW